MYHARRDDAEFPIDEGEWIGTDGKQCGTYIQRLGKAPGPDEKIVRECTLYINIPHIIPATSSQYARMYPVNVCTLYPHRGLHSPSPFMSYIHTSVVCLLEDQAGQHQTEGPICTFIVYVRLFHVEMTRARSIVWSCPPPDRYISYVIDIIGTNYEKSSWAGTSARKNQQVSHNLIGPLEHRSKKFIYIKVLICMRVHTKE